jgi:hemerythrin-like domain-containing protein
MKLIGILMQEHRIIEKTLNMFEVEIKRISEENHIDAISMYVSIDFIRTYTDQAHHGKEENILFRELLKKDLLSEHAKMLNELMAEHKYSRGIVSKWMDADKRSFDGEDTSQEIISYLKELIQFYPQHIMKEDEHFFNPILDYFGA